MRRSVRTRTIVNGVMMSSSSAMYSAEKRAISRAPRAPWAAHTSSMLDGQSNFWSYRNAGVHGPPSSISSSSLPRQPAHLVCIVTRPPSRRRRKLYISRPKKVM